jgi:flagellar capping protein FliD
MSTLRLPGLLTGIDTNALIAQLMAIERRRLNVYEQRKSLWDERKDALSTLETKLETLRSTVRALADARELRAFATASSDSDILTAEASYNAFEGNHTVVINQLANAERWVHTAGLKYAEDYVGAGTFIYSYNHKETAITTTATTTLEDLVGLINNDANNPGVTATLLYYKDAYHLVLNGNEPGTDYNISVNSSSTEVWEAESALTVDGNNAALSTKIIDLDQFSGTLGATDKITINGTDKSGNPISQVELAVTGNTKITHLISEINDAFDGIAKAAFVNGKIVLTDDSCGASDISISLEFVKDPGGDAALTLPADAEDWTVTQGGTAGTLTDFEPADFSETQSAQDSEIRVDGYPTPQAGIAEVQTLEATTLPTGGTYTLTYDGQTTAPIDRDARANDIQNALEALPNVNPGDIEVSGERLDRSGPTIFTFLDTAGDVNMISINSGNLTPSDPSNYVFTEQTKGNNYGWISRSSNTIDDVIHGVTLHLHDTTDASGEEITLTRDIESVKQKLDSMVEAYNAAVYYIQEKTGYNDVLKTAGILMADYVVSTLTSQLSTPLINQRSGFIEDIDTFLTPAHIGLEIDRNGVLTLDKNIFDEAIAEDYMAVLALIGADKAGSSDSNTIEFYGASSDYTTAGTYNVQVTVEGSVITSAKIKLSSESSYRDATYTGNIVTGNSSFNENGDPVYPENGLQLSVDLSQDATFTATVRVRQGFAGAIEDALDKMLKVTTGSIQIDQEYVADQIEGLQKKIELEEYRLEQKETRLIAQYARLERTLALLQNQMVALGFGNG